MGRRGAEGLWLGLSRKMGSELAREPFLSRWGQAGGRVMELVQEVELGRGWQWWPQAVAQPVSVPTSQGTLSTGGLAGIWFGLGASPEEKVKANSA